MKTPFQFLDAVGTTGSVFTWSAVLILLYAVFVPWLDTTRQQKTFGLKIQFFRTYVCAGVVAWVNAFLKITSQFVDNDSPNWSLVVLFSAFILLNTITLYLNTYIIRMKKRNMKAAEENGMSEQDYWEKVIKPTLPNA